MIKIRMPDNTIKEFDTNQVTGITLLDSIGSTKLKDTAALMIVKDGGIVDLDHNLKDMDQVEILTKTDPRVLETIRHSVAHVLAEAVKDLFPDAQLTIGPVIKDGFYYDFARESSFSTHDLEALEKRMREIIKSGAVFSRKEFSKSEAIEFFKKRGEDYKIEIIKDLSEEDPITIYFQGEFADLCRGPHVRSTKCIDPNAFKLTKVSGAYWRGDSKNAVLQRIYGAVFSTEQELNQHLNFLKEAEERDHRKIGREMDLFHFQEEAPGAAFWHPNGWTLFQTLVSYMRRKQKKAGYLEISTPELMSRCLWETSGHWEKFKECMYTARSMDEDRVYAIRPMNCPGGVQIFKHGLVSYRELPMRVAEFGRVHRFEASGALYGLMRVRSFVQDDAHIYCAENQLMEEVTTLCKFLLETYVDFGFDNVRIKFSDRPTTRIGSDTIWDKAEKALLDALEILGVPYTINKGEGAFYGPKLEFVLSDTIGRDWQIGTVQVDLNLPERFDISYIGEDGKDIDQ